MAAKCGDVVYKAGQVRKGEFQLVFNNFNIFIGVVRVEFFLWHEICQKRAYLNQRKTTILLYNLMLFVYACFSRTVMLCLISGMIVH